MPERELGNPGSYVIFENEHVRVWQNDLQPGESSDWHHHDNHYLFVATSDGDLRVEHDDGTSQANPMPLGKVVMGQKNSTHQLTNQGSEPYSSVIVEIKE